MFSAYFSNLANMCVDVAKQWLTWSTSTNYMGKAELGGESGDDWSDEFHLLFDDLVETII